MHKAAAFDLADSAAYVRWRDAKRLVAARTLADLVVDVQDPRRLSEAERAALLLRCAQSNMAVYRSPVCEPDKELPRLLGAQLGLHRLDANWLADEDGISPIAVAPPGGDRAGFIPYTCRPIRWHTDGYYHPPQRRILAMVLHCVRPALHGGRNALLDHEMAYIAVREANPRWIRALMADDAMTIPARTDEEGVARPEQSGPVFAVDPASGHLHMRYTARTRSIVWKDDPQTLAAVAFLTQVLETGALAPVISAQLQPGMGLVCNNVLHDRSGFDDDLAQPRLLYRARYLDRVSADTKD